MVAPEPGTYRIIFSPALDAVTLPVTEMFATPDVVEKLTLSVESRFKGVLRTFSFADVWFTEPAWLIAAVPVVLENVNEPPTPGLNVVEK